MTTNKPEHIYLIPDRMDGVDCDVWCDDPAPTQDHDPSDAVRYVRADIHEALQAECEKLRNGLKNARYRIEQGRIWNGMGWSLTGLHAYQQQRALDEIDAAMQGDKP